MMRSRGDAGRRRPPRRSRAARRGPRRRRRGRRRPGTCRATARACASAPARRRRRRPRRQRRIVPQPADVVDDGRAGGERGAGDLGLVGVDRDRAREARAASPSTTGSTRASSSSSGSGSAPGRVDSPPTSSRSAPSATICSAASTARAGIEQSAAVGKRVGRDVEDAHDERALAEAQRSLAGQGNGSNGGRAEHGLVLGIGSMRFTGCTGSLVPAVAGFRTRNQNL